MMLLPLLTVILLAVILLTTIQLDITDGLITTTDTRPFQTITNPATSIHLRRRLLQDGKQLNTNNNDYYNNLCPITIRGVCSLS